MVADPERRGNSGAPTPPAPTNQIVAVNREALVRLYA
jgi:hypothetical protein